MNTSGGAPPCTGGTRGFPGEANATRCHPALSHVPSRGLAGTEEQLPKVPPRCHLPASEAGWEHPRIPWQGREGQQRCPEAAREGGRAGRKRGQARGAEEPDLSGLPGSLAWEALSPSGANYRDLFRAQTAARQRNHISRGWAGLSGSSPRLHSTPEPCPSRCPPVSPRCAGGIWMGSLCHAGLAPAAPLSPPSIGGL